jgi:hypothetical protein
MKALQAFAGLVAATLVLPAYAAPLLSKTQYIDYQAEAKCIDQQFWDDPEQQEKRRNALDKRFRIKDSDIEKLDELAMEMDADPVVLDAIDLKMAEMCPQPAE